MDDNSNRPRINVPKSIFMTLLLIGAFNILPRFISLRTDNQTESFDYDRSIAESYAKVYDIHNIVSSGEDDTRSVRIVNDEDELLSLSYRYSHFSDKEKALYTELKNAIRSHLDRYDMMGRYTCDELSDMLAQLWYIDEYIVVTGLPDVTFWSQDGIVGYITIRYDGTKEYLDNKYESSMDVVSSILSSVCDMSQYEAEKIFHDKIIDMTRYVDTVDSHNACGVFLNNMAVCDGYSRAFKILCNRAGMSCDIVVGNGLEYSNGHLISSGAHAWNIVSLDNELYYVDVTFDDGKDREGTDYAYFNIGQQDLFRNHEITDSRLDFRIGNYMNYNYYNMMGYIAKNESDILSIFLAQVDNYIGGYSQCVRIKIDDDELFERFVDDFNNNGLLTSSMHQILSEKHFIYSHMIIYYSANNTVELYFE